MYPMDDKGFENTHPMPQFSNAQETPNEGNIEETIPTHIKPAEDSDNLSESENQQTLDLTTPIPVSNTAEGNENLNTETDAVKRIPLASTGKTGMTKGPGVASRVGMRRYSWLIFPILGLLLLVIIALISGVGGYFSGISLRRSAETTQVALAVQEQYQLGLQEMAQGEYHRARQRFEYVIQLNPNFPGVTEKLSEVLLELNSTATPTQPAAPTTTPTPDTRGSQELYDQAQQYLLNKEWKNSIDALLSLRKTDPTFRTVEVDGNLFLALRNQGVDKILKEADLEGGIYDLTLASHFGPLDSEAQGFLNWTGLYITGASFWDIDWEQAVNYFNQVAPQLPNLRDGSGMTATERLRVALYEYGNVLSQQGQYCRALEMYRQSLAIAPDPKVEEAAVLAEKGCSKDGGGQPGKTPKPGKKTPSP